MMYSTRAQDNKKIEAYTDRGTPLAEAMKQVAIDNNMVRFPVNRPLFLNETYDKAVSMLDAQILKMPERPRSKPELVSVAANDV